MASKKKQFFNKVSLAGGEKNHKAQVRRLVREYDNGKKEELTGISLENYKNWERNPSNGNGRNIQWQPVKC